MGIWQQGVDAGRAGRDPRMDFGTDHNKRRAYMNGFRYGQTTPLPSDPVLPQTKSHADREDYLQVGQGLHGQDLCRCPLCGHTTSMWQYDNGKGEVTKVVMCDNGEPLGDFDAETVMAGCPLYMPPDKFYKARYKTAAEFHRQFSEAVIAMRSVQGV